MGIINRLVTQFAKPTPPDTSIEIGTSTVGLTPTIFNEEFIDLDKIKVDDYKKMLDSDGTVQALYNTLVMPLLGCNWSIEPEDETPQAVEQSAWVEETLRTPPHKGGMSTPFDLVLAQTMRALVEGYAGFEKVYEIKDGKIVYKKIAWRDPTTITMRTDGRGGFNGFKQRAYINNQYQEVIIPLERCFLYTYGKEWHNLKGRSAFRSAYVAYDRKRRLQYLAEQQAQSDALKLKIVKGKEGGNQDELDATMEAVDEVGFKATVALPYGYDVDTLNNTNGMDLLPHIEFYNGEMARSVLAMFILLGTGSRTGTYSLSQDQSDFFIQALMSIRKSLENHITSYLIPDLYTYNFIDPLYGTFKFEDITDSTIDLLKQTFIKIVEKGALPDSVAKGVVQKMADKLDIDVDVLAEAIQPTPEPPIPPEAPVTPPEAPQTESFSTIEPLWGRRDLTKAEKKINLTAIENKLNTLEAETVRSIKPIWDELVAGANQKLNSYIETQAYDKITEKNLFDENLKNQYVKALKESGLEAYIYGKNGASDEMGVKAPQTPKESKDWFRDNAVAIADKQFSDLIFKIQTEISKGRRKDQLSTDLNIGDVISLIGNIFSTFYENDITLTATTIAATGVNKGRKDVFEVYREQIYAYQYSAILDGKTCPTCEALDGKVVSQQEYDRTTYDPPIHFYCRCLWVEILADEIDPPPITGFPDDTSALLEPSLSNELKQQIEELGRRAVNDEVTRLLAEE